MTSSFPPFHRNLSFAILPYSALGEFYTHRSLEGTFSKAAHRYVEIASIVPQKSMIFRSQKNPRSACLPDAWFTLCDLYLVTVAAPSSRSLERGHLQPNAGTRKPVGSRNKETKNSEEDSNVKVSHCVFAKYDKVVPRCLADIACD